MCAGRVCKKKWAVGGATMGNGETEEQRKWREEFSKQIAELRVTIRRMKQKGAQYIVLAWMDRQSWTQTLKASQGRV